jgi:uncharacterized membrane protein YqjE
MTDELEGPASAPQARVNEFVTSVGRLLATLIEMAYTRLELIFVELQEWVEGLVGVILWGLVAVFAAGASLLLGALALIFAFWDTHRVLVSLLVTGAFLVVTIGSAWMAVTRLRAQRSLLVSTLNEFAKDRELLKVRQ